MSRRWVLLLAAASLTASAALVNAAGSGAHGSTLGTNVKVWIGLKNSDDVGTSFDLKAEVTNGSDEGYGTTPVPVSGISSGFNNAHLATIPVNYSGSTGGTVSVTLFVRVSCTSKHTSGTARLWWNDAAANSRVEDSSFGTLYLTGASALSPPPAGPGPKMTKDVLVKKTGCPEQPPGNWKQFGTWAGTANHAPIAKPDGFGVFEFTGSATLGNILNNDSDPDNDPISVSSLGPASADTSGVTPLGGKLPGLTVTVTDNDFSDGFGHVKVHTDSGDAIVTISSGGTGTYSDPSGIFSLLNSGDFLVVNIGYTVSDSHGLSASSSFAVSIDGAGCLSFSGTLARSGTHRGLLSNRPTRATC